MCPGRQRFHEIEPLHLGTYGRTDALLQRCEDDLSLFKSGVFCNDSQLFFSNSLAALRFFPFLGESLAQILRCLFPFPMKTAQHKIDVNSEPNEQNETSQNSLAFVGSQFVIQSSIVIFLQISISPFVSRYVKMSSNDMKDNQIGEKKRKYKLLLISVIFDMFFQWPTLFLSCFSYY